MKGLHFILFKEVEPDRHFESRTQKVRAVKTMIRSKTLSRVWKIMNLMSRFRVMFPILSFQI